MAALEALPPNVKPWLRAFLSSTARKQKEEGLEIGLATHEVTAIDAYMNQYP